MHELFSHINDLLPTHLNSIYHISFRSTFGIWVGNFKPKKSETQAYHIHSTTSKNIDTVITAIFHSSQQSNTFSLTFNIKVTIYIFHSNANSTADRDITTKNNGLETYKYGLILTIPYHSDTKRKPSLASQP